MLLLLRQSDAWIKETAIPCGSASLSVSNARKALYRLQLSLIGHTTGSSPSIKFSG